MPIISHVLSDFIFIEAKDYYYIHGINKNTETQIEELIICHIVSNGKRQDSNPGCLITESIIKLLITLLLKGLFPTVSVCTKI